MKKMIFISVLVVLFQFSCQTKKESPKPTPAKLDSLFSLHPDFSGVVLVADKGRPIYHKAFGYKNLDTKTPMDTSTISELASVSKQFTGVLIMMLKEEGKLNYDDLLEKYVSVPYPGITIRHLLNHTSGIPDYVKMMDEHWDKSKVAGNEELIELLNKYHPEKEFEPGEKYQYSNTGYTMLGSVVEKVSGREFVEFAHERIFDPLQMSSTDIRSAEQKKELSNFAEGFVFVPEKNRYIRADSFPSSDYTIWFGARKGPGRISSTTSDLLKWDRALYTEDLLKKTSLQEAFTPARLNNDSLSYYGFGWEIRKDPSLGNVVFHGGDNPGYKSIIVRYIDIDKTIIMLHNNKKGDFYDIANGIGYVLGGDRAVALFN